MVALGHAPHRPFTSTSLDVLEEEGLRLPAFAEPDAAHSLEVAAGV
ncbi:hypothetical protein [Nonomuraea jabiensis]